jgi:hypothetical protein
MDVLYPFREVYQNYNRKSWWKARIAHRLIGRFQERVHESEFRVMDEEWDTLIVLDACREDLFREVVDISQFDSYETRTSAGSATNEWCEKNFVGQALTDTVYVTGNPVVSREVQTAFHAFIEVWRTGFDEEIGTVPPDVVTKAAVEARKNYPNKRLIVHYLQPHYPFIGYPELRYANFGDTEELNVDSVKKEADDVWQAVDEGLVDSGKVWSAYADNLEKVMDDVQKLIGTVEGKTVITSDHGNLLGEKVSPLLISLFGHPPNVYHSNLREVPWAVIKGSKEKNEHQADVDVEKQLESLGYV